MPQDILVLIQLMITFALFKQSMRYYCCTMCVPMTTSFPIIAHVPTLRTVRSQCCVIMTPGCLSHRNKSGKYITHQNSLMYSLHSTIRGTKSELPPTYIFATPYFPTTAN